MQYWAEEDSKFEVRCNVAKYAYKDLAENDELFIIMDEFPDEVTLDNSINSLQELTQKVYISM